MKKKVIQIVIALFVLSTTYSCSKKNDASIGRVIFNLTVDNSKPLADGTMLITVSCNLGPDATVDRRNILFTCSSGKFIATKDTSILSQKATFINNSLVATVKLIVPQMPATIAITAQPDLGDLPNNNYVITKSIVVGPSVPAKIKLNSAALVLTSNFGSEVAITGTVTNSLGGKVSFGNKVKFQDYLQGGTPANGTFRSTIDTTSTSSTVSTFYSIGNVAANSKLYVIATVLSNGASTGITDTLFFNINK